MKFVVREERVMGHVTVLVEFRSGPRDGLRMEITFRGDAPHPTIPAWDLAEALTPNPTDLRRVSPPVIYRATGETVDGALVYETSNAGGA